MNKRPLKHGDEGAYPARGPGLRRLCLLVLCAALPVGVADGRTRATIYSLDTSTLQSLASGSFGICDVTGPAFREAPDLSCPPRWRTVHRGVNAYSSYVMCKSERLQAQIQMEWTASSHEVVESAFLYAEGVGLVRRFAPDGRLTSHQLYATNTAGQEIEIPPGPELKLDLKKKYNCWENGVLRSVTQMDAGAISFQATWYKTGMPESIVVPMEGDGEGRLKSFSWREDGTLGEVIVRDRGLTPLEVYGYDPESRPICSAVWKGGRFVCSGDCSTTPLVLVDGSCASE